MYSRPFIPSLHSHARTRSHNCASHPFFPHRQSEAKHVERMAVRAKYMALDARANRYVASMGAIRAIQAHLLRRAERARLPCVDNASVDRSVGALHLAVMG